MAKRKVKKAETPKGVLSFAVNGHSLTGAQFSDGWVFQCPDWPDLAKKYHGADTTAGILDEFMGRCLVGAIVVRELASGT